MAQSPYGQQARSSLQQRLPIGRGVSLAIQTTDRYGRSVAALKQAAPTVYTRAYTREA